MPDLHPTLIRANVALFTGDYAEVRRLLADYRAEGGGAAEHAPMALWLDAHAQTEPEERLRRLDALTTVVAPDDTYGRLAQTILDLERPAPLPPAPRLGARGVVLVSAVLLIALIGLFTLLTRPQTRTVADLPPTATVPVPTAAPLPDRSRPLTASAYTARYAGGILQVTAVEDDSRRILGPDGAQVQPVPGARFFAVELAFECRIAICRQPPEADVVLRLTDGTSIAPRANVFVQNQGKLAPVALGTTTRGWMIFEIPSIVAVSSLEVRAENADGTAVPENILLE